MCYFNELKKYSPCFPTVDGKVYTALQDACRETIVKITIELN